MTMTDGDYQTDRGTGLSVELFAKLDAGLGRLNDHLDREQERRRREVAIPAYARIVRNGTADASGFVTLDLDGPTMGYSWYVRNLVVGGLTVATVAGGSANIYVTAQNATTYANTHPSLIDWRDRAPILPLMAYYGRGEMALEQNEKLVVVFSGATEGQQYIAAATIENHQEGILAQTWGI
jgi:hypothetical protein